MIDDSLARRLLDAPAEAVAVLRAADALDLAGVQALITQAGRLADSEPESAIRLLDIVESVALTAEAEPAIPAGLYLRARLTLEAGRPAASLALIASAREAYDRLGLHGEALRTELGRMHALDDLGRHVEATQVGRELLAGLDRLPSDEQVRRLRASALGNLGVSLGFTGRHDDALWAYARSEAIWRTLGDAEAAAAARANQGIELIALGRAPAALRRLDAAAEAFAVAGDRFWYAKCLGHRGEALAAFGRYGDALDDLRLARHSLQELGAQTEAWRVAIDTASVLLGLGLAEEAAVVVDEITPGLREAGVRHDLAAALGVRGVALAKIGRGSQARSTLTESARLYEEVEDLPNQARVLLELSRCLAHDEALALARRAAELIDARLWPGIGCLAALRLAELLPDDPDTAGTLLDEAARIAADLGLPHLKRAVDLRRGTLRLHKGDLDAGIEFLSRSLLEAEQIGIRIRDEGLLTAYVSSCAEAADHLVAALLDRGAEDDLARAAALSDRAKAGTLADVLRGAIGLRTSSPDDTTLRLTSELDSAYTTLFAAPAEGEQMLRARVDALERRVAVAQTLAKGGATSSDPRPQARLPSQVTSVAYHVLGEEVVAFVTVDGNLLTRRRVTDRRHLLTLLDELEGHLGGHAVAVLAQHATARAGACRRVLQKLFLAVFAPVLDMLPAPVSAAPLVIVPHGPLHRVPFQALHDGRQYLLTDWVITVSPSVEVAAGASTRLPRTGAAVVVGVADDATPFVEDEARRVAEVIGGAKLFIGENATFQALCEHAERAGLVHLACHGLFRPGNSRFTSLRLADRWVRAADVAELDLHGAVLVLSACETGRIGHRRGDEAAGLARGFLAAGARCVIVSRWLADDRSTAELMVRLHREIAVGSDPPTALRAAQLGLIEDHPHPFYWAPFTAVGAPSSSLEETR